MKRFARYAALAALGLLLSGRAAGDSLNIRLAGEWPFSGTMTGEATQITDECAERETPDARMVWPPQQLVSAACVREGGDTRADEF